MRWKERSVRCAASYVKFGGQRFHLGGTDCKSRRLGVGRTWKAGLKDAMAAARATHRLMAMVEHSMSLDEELQGRGGWASQVEPEFGLLPPIRGI